MNFLLFKNQRGFTVVELLIVIVVIAVLATVTVVGYNGIQASARDKSLLSDVDAIEGELARYASKNAGTYGAALNWYSPSVANTNIEFIPTKGNVIDVVASSTGYCIRAYNPKAKINSLQNAYKKGSSDTACTDLYPSSGALADSPLPAVVSTNFENGSLSIWSYSHMDATLTVSTERPYSGTRSAKQVHTDTWTVSGGMGSGDPGDGLRATVSGLTVGKTYRFSAWVYTPTAASSSLVFWQSVTPAVAFSQGTPLPFNTWVDVSTNIVATSTSHYVFINSRNSNTATSNGVTRTTYIDDIRVSEL